MDSVQLNIAGARIVYPEGFSSEPVNPHFVSFLSAADGNPETIRINDVLEDVLLNTEPKKAHKHSELVFQGSQWIATRRSPEGVVIWRARISPSFESSSISVNPKVFGNYYHSKEDLIGRDLGFLLVVLFLTIHHGIAMHGSCSLLNSDGVLCLGASGVGKSTISHLINASGGIVLSDERPFVRRSGNRGAFMVHGSPWPNIGGRALNESGSLRRVYFLEHGVENLITPLSQKDASARMLKVATIPWDDERLFDPCLKTVDALLASVPAAVLSFRPDEEVVDVIRQDLATEREII